MSVPDRAPVVSLMARAAYRADFHGLASAQLRGARQKLGLHEEEFADRLSEMVGWVVDSDLIGPWENGRGTPPGDVVLAASHVLGDDAPAMAMEPGGRLLGSVTATLPAQALAGYWVTCYDFEHAGRRLYHADVACVTAESEWGVRVTNHPPEPRTDGRAFAFRNEIEARLASRHLVGHWRNTSDTRYFGSLHLAVLPGETVMEGYYTGLASDISVSEGCWKWVRLDTAEVPRLTLHEPSALHGLIAERSQDDAPLALADIGEE